MTINTARILFKTIQNSSAVVPPSYFRSRQYMNDDVGGHLLCMVNDLQIMTGCGYMLTISALGHPFGRHRPAWPCNFESRAQAVARKLILKCPGRRFVRHQRDDWPKHTNATHKVHFTWRNQHWRKSIQLRYRDVRKRIHTKINPTYAL